MATTIKQLTAELEQAYERIEELEEHIASGAELLGAEDSDEDDESE